jgi:hypothetical protein
MPVAYGVLTGTAAVAAVERRIFSRFNEMGRGASGRYPGIGAAIRGVARATIARLGYCGFGSAVASFGESALAKSAAGNRNPIEHLRAPADTPVRRTAPCKIVGAFS